MNKNRKIIISPLQHRGEKRIKVVVPYEQEYIQKIKQIEGRKWSRTHSCWHLPYNKTTWKILQQTFGDVLEVKTTDTKSVVNAPPMSSNSRTVSSPTLVKFGDTDSKMSPNLKVSTSYRDRSANLRINRLPPSNAQELQIVEQTAFPKRLIAMIPHERQDWVQQIKEIRGRMWHPESKFWTVPYTKDVLAKLQSVFGGELKLTFTPKTTIPDRYVPPPKKEKNQNPRKSQKKKFL